METLRSSTTTAGAKASGAEPARGSARARVRARRRGPLWSFSRGHMGNDRQAIRAAPEGYNQR
eukprot:12573866-Alexandrium_andersonii.AAC.1